MSGKRVMASGHTFEDVTGEVAERLKKNYTVFTDGVIRATPGNWILPKTYETFADQIYNFKARPTDIYVSTFPKSGTTWMQEIVWHLVNNPDLDNPIADTSLDARFPNFDVDMLLIATGIPPVNPDGDPMRMFDELFPGQNWREGFLVKLGAFANDPRLNKFHIPPSFVNPDIFKTSKVVYVARDPRDVMISFYHYARLQVLYGFKGDLARFVEDFTNDEILYGPYFQHLKEGWERRNDPNVLFIFYEDMKEDPIREIKKVDKFIGTNRTDQQIENVSKNTSFSQMKEKSVKNPPTSNDNLYFNKDEMEKSGGFFRQGKVGTWKKELSPELQEKVNQWVRKNLAQFGEGFKYTAELP